MEGADTTQHGTSKQFFTTKSRSSTKVHEEDQPQRAKRTQRCIEKGFLGKVIETRSLLES